MLNSVPAIDDLVARYGRPFRLVVGEGSANSEPTETSQSPLVLMVHGRAGNDGVMWVFSKAFQQLHSFVVAPQALLADPVGGFSWWRVIDSPLGPKATMDEVIEGVLSVKSFLEQIVADYKLEGRPVIGVGFSQGAALVGMLSVLHPELFSGVAMLSGFLPKSFMSTPSYWEHLAQRQAPVLSTRYFLFHGEQDEVIPVDRSAQVVDALEARGANCTFIRDAVGHKVSSSGVRALTDWVNNGWGRDKYVE